MKNQIRFRRPFSEGILLLALCLGTVPAGPTANAASTGAVVAWGLNSYGQTSVPAALGVVTAIAAGSFHAVALRGDGTVVAWGAGGNNYGQTTVPTGLSGVTAVAAGYGHSMALKSDGTVVAWGRNNYSQVNVPAGLSGVVAVAGGYGHTVALKNDGTVVSWGYYASGLRTQPAGLNGVTAIAVGDTHTVALKNDGTVITWGTPYPVPAGLSGVMAIAAGGFHTLALKSNGTVVAWGGLNSYGQTTVPAGLSGVIAIAAGYNHSLALKSDGTVVAWGLNDQGQSTIPAGLSSVTAITAGWYHSVALTDSPLIITVQPSSRAVPIGNIAVFNVSAFSALPLTYQWRFNGTNLPGADNASLPIFYPTATDAGDYSVVVINSAVSVTSAVAHLSVNAQLPVFTYLPANVTVLAGSTAFFYAPAIGGPPPAYQWRFNGADLTGQTNSVLNLFNVATNQSGQYTVIASNNLGSTSAIARLTVNVQAPAFVTQPNSATVVAGSSLDFNGFASAGPPPTYYLQLNGTNTGFPFLRSGFSIYDLTPSFSILEVTANDAGNYTILASNYLGWATSQVATLVVTPAGPLDRWHRRNPLPQGNELLHVTYGAGRFLAVGENGAILTSPDGTNWTVQALRTAATLNAVTYGAGLFVAVGKTGVILTSADGAIWNQRATYPASSYGLSSVAYGNGRFVAVGPVFVTSRNGIAWETQLTPANAFNSLTFGNGVFVAVTDSGEIWTSANGVAWSQKNSGTTAELEAVTFGGGQFVAVGSEGVILTSPDAENWTTRSSGITQRLRGIAHGNSTFVAVGSRGNILRSSEGIRWTADVSGTPDRLNDVTFANGTFVAVGENGTIVSSTGLGWASESSGTRRDLDGMTSGNNQIVVVGKFGTILTSSNGASYVARLSGTTNDLHGVGFGNGLFVAVGEPGVVLASSNAVNWTPRTSGTTNYLKRVRYLNGLWVAVGDGVLLTSSNGADWTRTGDFAGLTDVTYGNGRFVAVSSDPVATEIDGRIYSSFDAVSWSAQSDSDKGLRAIFYTNYPQNMFAAAGNDGSIVFSPDGIAWTTRYIGWTTNAVVTVSTNGILSTNQYTSVHNLRDVNYVNGLWTVVGNDGTILTSQDTVTWKRRVSRTTENLHGIGLLNDTLVAIGNRGTILQSDSMVPRLAAERAGSNLRLIFSSPYEGAFKLQETTNFVWRDLVKITNDFGTVEHSVALPSGTGNRFYRIVTP